MESMSNQFNLGIKNKIHNIQIKTEKLDSQEDNGRPDNILGVSLVRCIRVFNTQGIERIPRILIVHPEPDPLRNNLLLPLHNRTPAVLRESAVHFHAFGIDVAEECCPVLLRFDVNVAVAKARGPSHLWRVAVHNYGGHAISGLELQAGAVAVAVGHVPVRSLVARAAAKVLDGHEILLPVLFYVERQHVIHVIVHASGEPGNEIPILLLLPAHLDARLLRLPGFRQLAPPATVGHRRIVQYGLRGLLHRITLIPRQEVLDDVNPRRWPVDHHVDLASHPALRALGRSGVHGLVGARVILDEVAHALAYLGLEGYFLVGLLDLLGDAFLDAS
mmetsp:Transcript_18925/g.45397  ORF Transcript_18925/g.45397 Transcript_18925/m.45397 type:complete len:332 (-) Transcript_18925:481-1476(-)